VPKIEADPIEKKCDGGQSRTARRQDTYPPRTKTGIGVMVGFTGALDRVWPQVSLAMGLTFGVVCIGGLEYGFLRLVW
jgi:hypothetical protein